MRKTCKQCTSDFEITKKDLVFYDKISPVISGKKYPLPPPTLCNTCRHKRRLAFRNERNLYQRTCDLTQKKIISIYSSDKKNKVYSQETWLSDQWDPLEYGKDMDFSRPFFEQLNELSIAVPHPGAGYRSNSENCDYTTYQNHSKNCYLTSGSGFMEDCAYTNWSYYAKNSYDLLGSNEIEFSYNLVDCKKMYSCKNCQDCSDLADCDYCYDCHSCQNCFGCVRLRHKKFCFLNEQITETEYKEKIKDMNLKKFQKDFDVLKISTPHRAVFHLNCEHCTGDHLVNCKNVIDSFQMSKSQDCRFNADIIENKDCYDCDRTGISELAYECIGGGWYNNSKFCLAGNVNSECYYSLFCFNSKNIFGSVALRYKEYCILNKQYRKEEYEKIVPKIIELMEKTGEWGEFLSIQFSPFAYNETLAMEYFPMEQEQALQKGLKWQQKDNKNYLPQTYKIPSTIKEVNDSIIGQILACRDCGKNYQIITMELKFYRSMNIPIPLMCPDCRHKKRMKLRNPRRLWTRKCNRCNSEIQTTFSPDRPETVYCEKCYLETLY